MFAEVGHRETNTISGDAITHLGILHHYIGFHLKGETLGSSMQGLHMAHFFDYSCEHIPVIQNILSTLSIPSTQIISIIPSPSKPIP